MVSMLSLVTAIVITVACGTSNESEILEVTVGPDLRECVGVGPMTCMVVDGELFYGRIQSFNHEPGYVHRLKIERYDAWPDRDKPPADASRYGYRLVEVLSKTPAE